MPPDRWPIFPGHAQAIGINKLASFGIFVLLPDTMNAKTYYHALLQYRHSQTLGEVMNIGLIVYFPSHRHVAFLISGKVDPIALCVFRHSRKDH